jgi:cytoskeletal protein CcmA (bactofilin family)
MEKVKLSSATGASVKPPEYDLRGPNASIPHELGAAWVEERTRIAVGPNITVSGKLIFQEPVRIEGLFRGEVSSSELIVISERGSIEGRVRSPRLLVLGELRGDIIESRLVVLGPRARVSGRVDADALRVCEGAHLEGEIRVAGRGTAQR